MKRKSEEGQVLISTALAITVIMGFAGLAIDMGVMRYDRRYQQSYADAGALAGANNWAYSGVSAGAQGAVTLAAQNDNNPTFQNTTLLTDQACPTSVTTPTVTVNSPPQSGPHFGKANYVEVCVAQLQPTFFMRVFGVTGGTVSARAVATNLGGSGPNTQCMITLDPNTAGIQGFNINGTAQLQAPTCGIGDNGNFNCNGSITVNAGSFAVSGSSNCKGGANSVTCQDGQTNCPSVGAPPSGDPLAYLTPPSASAPSASCPGTPCDYVASGGTTSSPIQLQPGYYNSLDISNNSVVNFSPGLYYIDCASGCSGGGAPGLDIKGRATVTGTGVTFYFTNTATVYIDGTASVTVSAGAGGYTPSLSDILMYQNPSDTSTGTNGHTGPSLGGNDGSSFTGALYFPSDNLTFFGNNTTGISVGDVITGEVTLSGHPVVNLLGSAGMPAGGEGLVSSAVLVE